MRTLHYLEMLESQGQITHLRYTLILYSSRPTDVPNGIFPFVVVFRLNFSRLFLVRQKPQSHDILLHLVIVMLLGEDYKFT
jgi:hypothetical protein